MSDINEAQTIYVPKYALTIGAIEVMKARLGVGDRANWFYPERDSGYSSWTSFKKGRDAFLTLEEAQAAVVAARQKRIASLKKQIAKLEAMGELPVVKL